MSLIARRVARLVEDDPYEEGADTLVELEKNLVGLMRGIPEYATFDDIPLRFQRHMVEVPGILRRLLSRVI